MAIPNAEYWAKRFTELEKKQNQNSVEFYNQVKEEFDKAQAQIQKELDVFFSRFAENNNISLNEAKKILNDKELKEFKWTVEEYIQKGQENAVNGKWINQLENASTRWRISRLESLQIQLQQQAEILFGNYADEFDKFIINTYKNERLRTAYEIQRGINVGTQITGIDEDKLKIMINKPWTVDGENFSMRIWRSKSQLINELNTQLIQACILGHSVDKMASQLAGLTKAFDTDFQKAKSQSARLINTESAYFSTLSRKNTFQELDVEEYEIVSTLDNKTSEICQDMDGKHFPVSQMQVGVNAPPFHVNCRTTTVPYFNDEFTVNDMRIARGEDGKTYYVPSDMTYKQWKQSFVESDKTGLQEATPDDAIKAKKEVKQVAEELKAENFPSAFTAKKSEMKNTQALVDYVNSLEGADANTVALFNRMSKLESVESNSIPFKISHGKNHEVSTSYYPFTEELAEVKLTIPKLQGENLAGQVNITLHEEMHLMDLYGRSNVKKSGNWFSTSRQSLVDKFKQNSSDMSDDVKKLFAEYDEKCKEVSSAVRSKYNSQITALNDAVMNRTFQGTYSDYNKQYNKLQSLFETERDYECRNIMGGGIGNLQDIYDALSGGVFFDTGVVKFGHGGKYYQSVNSRVHETIANYAALSVTRPDLIELLRADKPELVAELDAVIIELLKKAGGE